MSTIFSKIAAGEIPSYRIAADERHYAFLDINPVAPGHVLVIPRIEDDYIFNLSDDDYSALTLFAKRVAKAIEQAVPCKRVGVAVIGLEVPHTHIHLIPINSESDMDFHNKTQLPAEEMEAIAKAISSKYDELYPGN
ncbi:MULTISPECIES: HIT family protein [Duncaniella]|jgi:histidine triad (HIT) family protein|uniref:HIT family protein n=1 Tax=Duncaniella dubosii TaxID=2518971 RepID=A0A4V1D385_9BACT|nr:MULTISPECIES: HIT family protein [Duncaniella]MBJ2190517.1 HIT family protein [Muribaculaceae bacterium]ROS89715.1 HIT family protein [Muribaculaceae bacterium Isolate-080 (Janvier)]HBN63319.1 HIT family protein [Porphyromonadaceae bacterium]MCX4283080.1 HIT family protein [Duncaniella dubosii]QCD42128.1 HIT family protein [Duncaniella dubosii]